MEKTNTVFVTGATGNQGSAAVRHLLLNGFKVKALVRDLAKAKTKLGQHTSLELIEGDLNKPATWKNELAGVNGIFCLLVYLYGVEKEIQQAKSLIDLSKEYNVPHFVYSSVIGNDLGTGIPHWESKFIIEKYIRQKNIGYTILRPASLYENFLIPDVRKRILKGKLVSPVNKSVVQQFISADDIGRIATIVFKNPAEYKGRTLTLAFEQMDFEEITNLFSECMHREIKFQKLPGFLTRLFMGRDLHKMFTWVNKNNAIFVKDIEQLKREFPGHMPLRKWIEMNFAS